MKQFIFGLLFLIAYTGQAQITGQVANYGSAGGSANSLGQLEALMGPVAERENRTAGILANMQGSPYTSNDFKQGTIFYKEENNGKVFFRYNSYNEEIEIKEVNIADAPLRSLGRDKNIAMVSGDGKSLRFSTFIDKKGLTQNGYLTLLLDGKYALYLRSTAKFTEGQKAPNSFVKAKAPKFTQFEEYYIEIEGLNRVDEIQLKNSKLLKLLPSEVKPKAQAYIKENKLNIKNIEDLKAILTFLNTEA